MKTQPSPIATRYKVMFYCAAWAAALLATDPSLKYAPLVYMFPLGLIAFDRYSGSQIGGWPVLIALAGVYLLHAVLFFRARSRQLTIALAAVLLVLLVWNVSGCREMLRAR